MCSKISGECHVFLVLTVNMNVKKTRDKHCVYSLGKTSENILKNKVFTGVFSAQKKMVAECHVFLVFTVNINVKKI